MQFLSRFLMVWGLAVALAHAGAATGPVVPELSAYDSEIEAFLRRWGVPGGAVAVTRNGRLVLARGYGVTDAGGSAAVQPDTLFRIASVSKPITAIAVMKLIEDGILSLDMPVFPYLARGTPADTRLNAITVRHLLEHTGGWDRDIAGDPMFNAIRIAQVMGVASPPDAPTILRYMLTQPLQYEPGTRYAYSNFGFLVLGEVVSKATGQRYEDHVRTLMLQAGVQRMRVGASLPSGRLPGESGYALPADEPQVTSVFASQPGRVPQPYGGFAIEPMAAHGGWVASAIDLVAIASLMDGNAYRADGLSAASIAEMRRRPAHVAASASSWYAKGWQVNTAGNIWHGGKLPGTAALLVSASNGTQWAAVFNLRDSDLKEDMANDLDDTLWAAYRAVKQWPTHDLFASLHGPAPVLGCYGHATFRSGVLCLPELEVPGQLFSAYFAILDLTNPAALEFTVRSAGIAVDRGASTSRFDAATGVVTVPRVLLSDPSGVPKAFRVELTLVPGGGTPRLRLKSATAL